MEIGQKLKNKRIEKGLSQEVLAERIGVTRQTISSWENNRSYPDIGSVLKLSDLYDVSLDELLKEDEKMRKHVEESAKLTTRYWNILFEVAILLLPFGSLVIYWGLYGVGLTMQIVGLLMLPFLWIARWKLFGMPKEHMRKSLIGWGLFVGAALSELLSGGNLVAGLCGNLLALVGLLMIYSYGVYLERGKRFWLVIALYFGIPLYIFGSSLIAQFDTLGAFSKAQPFGSEYRIAQVLYGEAESENAIVELDQFGNDLIIDSEIIGEFEYVKPVSGQQETILGIWHLVPEGEADTLYKLEVSSKEITTLSCLKNDRLQWSWEIQKIPAVWFALTTSELTSASRMDFYNAGTFSGDGMELNYTSLSGTGTMHIECRDNSVTELKLTEEYHFGNQVETREYTLQKDKNGNFPFPEELSARYEGAGQYAVYSIEWDGGEYLFRLDFK